MIPQKGLDGPQKSRDWEGIVTCQSSEATHIRHQGLLTGDSQPWKFSEGFMKATHDKNRMLVSDTEGLGTRLGQHQLCKPSPFHPTSILLPSLVLGKELNWGKDSRYDALLTISFKSQARGEPWKLTPECVRRVVESTREFTQVGRRLIQHNRFKGKGVRKNEMAFCWHPMSLALLIIQLEKFLSL